MKATLKLLICLVMFASCEKDAGDGGNSSIKGSVRVKNYGTSSLPVTPSESVAAINEDVFIIYGDNVGVGDKVQTNQNGEYEFVNLREGKYTIFAKSKDSTALMSGNKDAIETAVVKEVEITGKKQEVQAPGIVVHKY